MTGIAKGLVAYTDGSSIPPENQHGAGYAGSGIHGYYFHTLSEKEKPYNIGRWQATEKGYVLKTSMVGLSPVMIDGFYDAVLPLPGNAVSNNYAEMYAAIYILQEAVRDESLESLTLHADSRLVVDGTNTWMHDWVKNGWMSRDNRPIKNRELWETIYRLVTKVKEKMPFSIHWVRGHNDDQGNSFADYNAAVASQKAKAGLLNEVVTRTDEVKAYFDAESCIHPFLNQKRVYFNSCPDYNEKGIYYQTSWKGDDFILGRRSGETSYSVIALTTPDPVIETTIYRSRNHSEHNIVMYAKMDRMRDSIISRYIDQHGGEAFIDDYRNKNINFVDRKPLVHACKPGELPLRAFDTLQYLRSILGKVVRGDITEAEEPYQLFDITDVLYEKTIKRSKQDEIEVMSLRKEFGVGFTLLDVKREAFGHLVDFKIYFGDDLPSRNQLKKIEGLNPMVQLVVWRETTQFLRYACVISIDDAHGIWSNYFSNQVVLKPK